MRQSGRVSLPEPFRRDTRLDTYVDAYAERTHGLTVSAVRALFAVANRPEVVSLAGGMPNIADLPRAELGEAVARLIREQGTQAMQYGSGQGEPFMREKIVEVMAEEAIQAHADDIVVSCGSQQALDLVTRVFCDPGDVVLAEGPSYVGALGTFHAYQCEVVHIAMDDHGIIPDALAHAVVTLRAAGRKVKFLYTIPNFQNPTGLTYTQAVRERAAEILKAAGTPVIEDNPYGELRFHGEGGSSFATLLGEQCAAMGTFSKIVAPGMRIGWIACKQPELYAKLLAFKSTMDLHTNIFGQMVLAQYLLDNDLDDQIEKIKEMYREKAEKMMACMAEDFPADVKYTKPEGGMFIWATMPEGLKAVDVMEAAAKKGVAVCPGDPFYEEDRDVRTMRINYSNSSDEAIEKGIKILGDTIKKLLAK